MCYHAMRTGNLEAAALTLDEVLSLIQDGFELSVILAMDVSAGADVLLAKPEIATLADLRGKQVAVEYSGVGAIMLDAALEAAGLTAADIVIVACTVDNHEICYLLVDAVVTFEPVKTRLMARGAQILFDSSLIPGRIVDVLVVRKDIAESQPTQFQLLLAGYFQALEYLQTQTDDAARRITRRLGISPEEVLTSFDGMSIPGLAGNKSLLGDGQESLQTTADYLIRIMLEKYLLRNTFVMENLTDESFLPD